MDTPRHLCFAADGFESGPTGHAIDQCREEDDGEFWAGNGEYATQVRFCPFCGAESPASRDRWRVVVVPSCKCQECEAPPELSVVEPEGGDSQ